MQGKKRLISKKDIEAFVTDLITEGYDEDRIIDHLERCNKQRKKHLWRKPVHISSLSIIKKVKNVKTVP